MSSYRAPGTWLVAVVSIVGASAVTSVARAGDAPLGAPCTLATDCASALCADGVCCNAACDGVCEACDVAAMVGTCTPVEGAAKHGACPAGGADLCSPLSCDGAARTSCVALPGPEVTCSPRSCSNGIELLPSKCNGSATCPAAEPKVCDPYACDGTQCRTTCRSDFDCKSGIACDVVSHECKPGKTCDGDHTVTSITGETKNCSPLRCAGAACLESCTSSSDCVAGFVCDPGSKNCVTSAQPPLADDGGCALPASGAHRATPWWIALALLASLRGRVTARSRDHL